MDKFEFRKYLYYGIIGIVSVIMLIFIPMLGSDVSVHMDLPNTGISWCIWILTKLVGAVLNMVIFYCFMEQSKINIKDNENYINANKILLNMKVKDIVPRSPKQWSKVQYGTKGVAIFVSSLLSAVVLTNAILTFNYVVFLTYIFVIIMGITFGIIQMKNAEQYWINEYYQYAIRVQEEQDKLLKAKRENKITIKELDKCLNLMENFLETYKNK